METLRKGARRVVLFQTLLTLLAAAAFGVSRGRYDFLSALYGGAVAVLLSAWLARGTRRAKGLVSLYANAITRYGAAVLFLGLGLGPIKLAPLPLMATFAIAQLGFLASMPRARESGTE